MSKPIALLAVFVAVVGAMNLGAAAQGRGRVEISRTPAECTRAADAEDFGIHQSARHRFVLRCVAGLPQR